MKQKKQDPPQFLAVQGAARYLGVSISTLRRMDKEGVLVPSRTPGGHRRYSRQMLDEYIKRLASAGARGEGAKIQDPDSPGRDRRALDRRVEELEQETTRLREQLEAMKTLQQTALDVSSHLEMPQLLETIIRRASTLTNATGGVVYLRPTPDSPLVEVVASYNLDRDYRGTRLSLGEGIGGRVTQSGEPWIVRDYRRWSGKAPHLQDAAARAIMAVPLTSHGGIHGTLEVIDSTDGRVFSQDDLNALMPLAHQAAVAIENALLYQEERRQRETADALREAAEIIGRSLDLDHILGLLLSQLEKLVPHDSSAIQLLKGGSLHTIAMQGFPAGIERKHLDWKSLANEIWQAIIHEKAPLIIPNVRDDPRWEVKPGLENIRSWIGVPIITREWVWGILTLAKAEPGFYDPQHADLAATVARYAATAIENAQLYTSAHHLGRVHQTRATQLASLQGISLRLSSTFELETVLRTLAEGALELTPADDTHIYFYDQDSGEFSLGVAFWRDGRREPAVVAPRADGLTATVARQGRPVIIEDAPHHPLYSDRVSSQWGVQTVAGFPLKRQERVIGVFNVAYLSPKKLGHDEMRILCLLADQAAVAIENARLYQQVQAHSEKLEALVAARTLQWQEEKERADVILAHAADGVVLTDAEGIIEYVNPSWERLTGFTSKQALGQNPRILKSGETAPETYEEMWQTIKAGKVWRGQLRNRRADGSIHDVDLTVAPVTNGEGKIVNFVGVHRDITALKEVARLKDDFVSNVSHELRTPIANLKLYQSLLQRGKPEKRETYLQVIARETARLEQLVTDLLDLSRLDQGAITLAPELLNLNGLAADVVNRLLRLAEERQVTLELAQALDLPPAWLDLHQITQVLTNLIVNALNYTPPGGQVTVETAQETREGRAGVSLIVQDSGIGIAPADKGHIFERFFRAQAARDTSVPGTGLGLAIAKEIVELHNGQIEVQSTLGKGSTFKVWLPLS
jgi:PAS domain S-box-containing protein/excisionase family DNA binding protein